MNTAREVLLIVLEGGAIKYDEACKRLVTSGKLGFGVDPEDVIGRAIGAGTVVTFDDGNKTWLRKAAPFVALERGDDWGVKYLAYKATRNGICSLRYAIEAKEGQIVEVQWPDGTFTTATIVFQSITQSPLNTLPGINVTHRGLVTWVPLDAPGLKVRADAF